MMSIISGTLAPKGLCIVKPPAIQWLKNTSFRIKWNVRAVWRVTEWRGGCVYRTRTVGYIICTPEYADMLRQRKDVQVGPLSTHVSKQLL